MVPKSTILILQDFRTLDHFGSSTTFGASKMQSIEELKMKLKIFIWYMNQSTFNKVKYCWLAGLRHHDVINHKLTVTLYTRAYTRRGKYFERVANLTNFENSIDSELRLALLGNRKAENRVFEMCQMTKMEKAYCFIDAKEHITLEGRLWWLRPTSSISRFVRFLSMSVSSPFSSSISPFWTIFCFSLFPGWSYSTFKTGYKIVWE